MTHYGKWYFINGVKQYVHVISTDLDHPILVYLHGGPGDAALPLVEHFNADLSKKYTFIIWEQRGSGKSYYKFRENESLTIDNFVSDLKSLVEQLLLEFNKDKVCLMGHSWGSIIGMNFIISYPELVNYYIGVGQVVCSHKMFDRNKGYILSHTDNKSIKNRVSSLDTTFHQDTWFTDLMYLMKQLIKQGVSLHGKSSYLSLYKYFVFSKNYSFADCIKRLKGSKQSIIKLWNEVSKTDFSSHKYFDVPIAFIEGEYDYHASSELVLDFYHNITSPKIYYSMENTAHFPQWTRADSFNAIVNSLDTYSFLNNNKVRKI